MFSAIKSFAKRNRVLFILLIVAVSITLSYYISYDIPELISGIEKCIFELERYKSEFLFSRFFFLGNTI